MRPSGRAFDALRSISFTRRFTRHAAGSVLVEFGDTREHTSVAIIIMMYQFTSGMRQQN